MKFLFEITAYSYNIPVIYKVSRVSEHEFTAEPDHPDMKPFLITRQGHNWIAESGYTHSLALRIARKIDKLQLDKYKKIQDFIRSCFRQAVPANHRHAGPENMAKQLANR